MRKYTTSTKQLKFVAQSPKMVKVNGELEWHLKVVANTALPPLTKVRITVPAYQHQRSEEYLQTYDYWKPNYVYAIGCDESVSVDTVVSKVESKFSHVLNWSDSNRIVTATVFSSLKKGQYFTVNFGGIDRPFVEGECPPSRAGQFANKTDSFYHYKVEYSVDGQDFVQVNALHDIEVVPERASMVKVYCNNNVRPDTPFAVNIVATDRFNNPVNIQTDNITIYTHNLVTGEKTDCGKYCQGKTLVLQEGMYHIVAKAGCLKCEVAAVLCQSDAIRMLWGDTHVHSNLTPNIRDNDGGAYPSECYRYAKDVQHSDFVCLVEQTFCFDDNATVNVTKEVWDKIAQNADKANVNGEFTVLSGFEIHEKRGDTVCVFDRSLSEVDYPQGVNSIWGVWDFYRGQRFLTMPHLHRYCNGRPNLDGQDKANSGFDLANWENSCDNERNCEVFSTQWGIFECDSSPMVLKARRNVKDNTVRDFLRRGKQWSFTASSDGHDGNPAYGGLTGVFCENNDRTHLFDALYNRQTVATTHTRFALNYKVDGQHLLGSYAQKTVNCHVQLVSPEQIRYIEFVNQQGVVRHEDIDSYYINKVFENLNVDKFLYARCVTQKGNYYWISAVFEKQ